MKTATTVKHTHLQILRDALLMVREVDGVFVELGVFRGNTLVSVIKEGKSQGKMVYGFDSFSGLPRPSEEDGDAYKEGNFDTGGCEGCIQALQKAGVKEDDYKLVQGFVPYSFADVEIDKISFAHVDLDLYRPTKFALEWVWKRLQTGGVILCHDYFKGRPRLASLAIDEFVSGLGVCELVPDTMTMRIRKV